MATAGNETTAAGSGSGSGSGGVDEGVDMRSNRLRYHKTRAKLFYQRGENSLNQKMLLNGFSLKFETAALYFYQASISYRAASKWREAGDALCRAAVLYQYRLKSFNEAASLYTEASECYEKVDNYDTIKCLVQSISLYCDLGQFVIAGKLQKYVADLQFSMKHYEEAYTGYRKASDFLSSLPNQSDICLENAIYCLIENSEYQLASELYLILAESCNQTNLKSFQTKYHLFHSLLCQMAIKVSDPDNEEEYENKYAAIRLNILSYESYDITWRCSKQALFLQNVITARESFDQHTFADHLYYYFTIYSFTNYEIMMLKVVSDEIVEELERRIEERKKELYEATKKQRRKAKLLKKRRQLRERGLNPFTIRMEDIEDDSSEEGNDEGQGEERNGEHEDDSLNSSKSSDGSESEYESSSSSGGGSDIELPEELKEQPPPPRRRRGDPKPT